MSGPRSVVVRVCPRGHDVTEENAYRTRGRLACVPCRRETAAESRRRLRLEVHNAMGGKCACCGEAELVFLCVDHVGGWGHQHRKTISRGASIYRAAKAEGYPSERYRVLCCNCNYAESQPGGCPHRREV